LIKSYSARKWRDVNLRPAAHKGLILATVVECASYIRKQINCAPVCHGLAREHNQMACRQAIGQQRVKNRRQKILVINPLWAAGRKFMSRHFLAL